MGDSLIKEKIIDAAIQLFNSRGYDSVSLRDIAKDLQISSVVSRVMRKLVCSP